MTAREAAEDCTSLVPKVNNEWTVDGDFIRAGSNLLLSIKAIVDAHKSALAAEREKVRFREREGIARLHQAVVKAQDDRTYVERLYHDQEKEVQQLRDQLAALKETQGREFTDLQQQLADERERTSRYSMQCDDLNNAIAEAERATNQKWHREVSKLIADHKKDLAAAQQPLITWIEEATDQLCGDKPLDKMALLNSYEKLPLAKVKEGK